MHGLPRSRSALLIFDCVLPSESWPEYFICKLAIVFHLCLLHIVIDLANEFSLDDASNYPQEHHFISAFKSNRSSLLSRRSSRMATSWTVQNNREPRGMRYGAYPFRPYPSTEGISSSRTSPTHMPLIPLSLIHISEPTRPY